MLHPLIQDLVYNNLRGLEGLTQKKKMKQSYKIMTNRAHEEHQLKASTETV